MKATLSIVALAAFAIAVPVVRRDQSTNEVDSTIDAVNYILKLQSSPSGVTAYDDEINAVTNPADIVNDRSGSLVIHSFQSKWRVLYLNPFRVPW